MPPSGSATIFVDDTSQPSAPELWPLAEIKLYELDDVFGMEVVDSEQNIQEGEVTTAQTVGTSDQMEAPKQRIRLMSMWRFAVLYRQHQRNPYWWKNWEQSKPFVET